MRRRLWILMAGCSLLSATIPVAGHHAFGAEFDPDAPIRLQGKVVKLEWVNPHAWIHIEVKKPDEETMAEAKVLTEAFFSELGPGSDFGSQFAQTVIVKCATP